MQNKTFDALAHEHRRELLGALLEKTPQYVDEHSDRDMDMDMGPVTTTKRLAPAMYHNHLPKLVEFGYVEWNRDSGAIHRGPQFPELRPLLEYVADHSAN